ncbi:MAG TPA: ABC transporter ATP-binding protein, partial [Chitinophagales bacterium]|nr:ABC transporter ATP-binding protein [Chitinophagales bacterium]
MTRANKIVFDFISRNKWLIGGTLCASLLSNLLNVLLPVSIGKFYEVALHDADSVKSRLMEWMPVEIGSTRDFFIFFGTLIILKVIFAFFEKYGTGVSAERFARRLRERVFAAQLSHTLPVHREKAVGKYLLRYSGDLRTVQNYLSKGILSFTGDVFFVLCAFTGLWLINPQLTLIALIVFSFAGVIVFFLTKKMRLASVARRNQRSKTLDFVTSRLSAFYTIKSFNRESVEEELYARRSRKLYKAGVAYYRISSFIQSLIPGFFFGALALMLAMIVRMNDSGAQASYGDVLVFVLLFLYMQGVTRRLLRVNLVWQEGKISLEKLAQIFNQPQEKRVDSESLAEIKGGISFHNVTFGYNERAVLKNVSFTIQPGSLVLVKGRQGSGKSTLLKLLQKMYEPQQGEIFIDGWKYSALSPFEIRKEVTIVSAETPLIGNTV